MTNKYINDLNKDLIPKDDLGILVLDLFAGCGGLSLGFEAQGFKTIGYEMETDACETYNHNLMGKCEEVELTTDMEYPKASVIIGGPPCQPFSVGGNQKGKKDKRNGFPIFLDAIKKVKPELWMFENVRGLLYKNKWYFDEIKEELESLGYMVEYRLLNARHFGVPQNRERVIVVGHKGNFSFPDPFKYEVTVGEALEDMMYIVPDESKFLTPSMDEYIARYEEKSKCVNPRDLKMDSPARTLTCRNLAGSTSDMHRIKLPDGRRRKLLIKEASRLQSFPDWFEFKGRETSIFNQIGNSVAPLFAKSLARSVENYLKHKPNHSLKENIEKYRVKQLSIFDCEELIDAK